VFLDEIDIAAIGRKTKRASPTMVIWITACAPGRSRSRTALK